MSVNQICSLKWGKEWEKKTTVHFWFGEAKSLLSIDSSRQHDTVLSTNHHSAWNDAQTGLGINMLKTKAISFPYGTMDCQLCKLPRSVRSAGFKSIKVK